MLKAHSGDSERIDRIGRPSIYLEHPRLSIGLSPQPDVVRGLASKPELRSRGLLARFLYLLPPSPLGSRRLESCPIPDEVRQGYNDGLRAMLDWKGSGLDKGGESLLSLKLTRRAYEEWKKFARLIEERMKPGEDLEYLTGWAGKAPGAAARVAGVLHGIKHAHGKPWEAKITADTMIAALELLTVIVPHSLKALNMMGADPTIDKAREVLNWIKRKKNNGFSLRDAFNSLRRKFSKAVQIKDALGILQERGYVKLIEPQRTGPGRPSSPVVRVRPGLW